MKKTYFILQNLFLLFFYNGFAQTTLPEFGNVSIDELKLKECSFEKDAPAMYLFNSENIVFKNENYSSRQIIERRVRIKIFNETGYKYTSIIIQNARSKYTKMNDFDAVIYNLGSDGKIISKSVDKDQVFKEKSGSKHHITNLHFTFPDVKPGSVIEYRYTLIKRNSSGINPWLFQDEIPILKSLCSVTIDNDIEITAHIVTPMQTDTAVAVKSTKKNKNSVTNIFELQKISSFKIEPFMTSMVDNIERIEFSLHPVTSLLSGNDANRKWQYLSSALMFSPFFGRQLYMDIPGTENAIDSIKAMDSAKKKIEAVYTFITQNVKWNNEQLFFAENVADAWKTKTGSSAEINLLIINLLKKVDVDCAPLLVSTRENGRVDVQFASMGQFNGVDVLVTIDSVKYVLDGTEEYQSFLIPPLNILNRDALLIGFPSTWISVFDSKPYMNSLTFIQAALDSTGVLRGKSETTLKDYAKVEELKEKNKDDNDKKEEAKDFLQYDDGDLLIDTVYTDTCLNAAQPLLKHLRFHYTLSNNDDYYFLNPFFFSMFRKNPFTGSTRNSDIDFGCMQHFLTYLLIDIPENYSVEEIPKSVFLRTSDTSIAFRKDVSFTNNQIGVRCDFELNNPFFDKKDYTAVKQFFDKIYANINEQILLKKK